MEIVYAAYTETGTFMLDERGVCRWAVAPPGKTHATVPERIVGAQYVATLDVGTSGGLADLPRVGCPMLFASVDETGRIQLVRTQPVIRFEDKRNPEASQGASRSSFPPPAIHQDREKTPARASSPMPAPRPPSSRPLPSTPPLPLVRPASPSPVPPRQSMIAPKMPLPPRSPSMATLNTPSAMRPIPIVSPPPRRSNPTIPPPPATDPSPPPTLESAPRISTNGVPSSSAVQSMPTRLKGASTQMRRMIRGR